MSRYIVGARTYRKHRAYFDRAYQSGVYNWPASGTSPIVEGYIESGIRATNKPLAQARALDIGCGEGRHAIAMARLGLKVSAIDLSPIAVRKAEERSAQAGTTQFIEFQQGNALILPFGDKAFDLVLDCGCFHHIVKGDWHLYFSNVQRVLKESGYFILGCFSTDYKHHEAETRSRKWLMHHSHYDRFFEPEDIRILLSSWSNLLSLKTERVGLQVFHYALAQLTKRGDR
jgi:ubiquinone/menaquinone biosynthesis C-methylase UbiE